MPASRPGFLNNKMELFCRFAARGETNAKAYELAGYAPSQSNAATLAGKSDIQHRIAELKKEFIEEQALHEAALARARAADAQSGDPSLPETRQAAEWSFNRIMDMIAENVRLAQVAGEYKAANDALKMMGDAMSMFDKANAGKQLPPGSPMTLIGKVVNQLGDAADAMDAAQNNPLAPR
jgi:phage terminase small subunit